jgi:competence protein ComGC
VRKAREVKVMRLQGKQNGEGGFTLAELLIVVLLMVLIIGAIGGMIQSGVKSSSASYSLVKVNEAGNEAMSVMVRQIRAAVAIDPSSTANTLIFAANLNGDIDMIGNEIFETAQFDSASSFLRKGSCSIDEGSPPMENWIAGCDQVTFTYWKIDDTTKILRPIDPSSIEWSTGGNTSVVRIDIVFNISRRSVGGNNMERTFTGSVSLRNVLQNML